MFTGSLVALVTPMQPGGAIDWLALEQLVEWHITQQSDALVVAGTTGECATLTYAEHVSLIQRVVAMSAGRLPVIAGTGANATQEAIALTEAAKAAGADACLLVTPYYNKPPQAGLLAHYRAIAQAVSLPQILYNVPARTAVDLLPETVADLAALPEVIGLKEATGSLARLHALQSVCRSDFMIYSGDDFSAAAYMLAGAQGNISVTANIKPAAMAALCRAALAGDIQAVEAEDVALQPLHSALFLQANPIPVKWALHAMGRIGSGIRLPLLSLPVEYQQPLRQALKDAQCL